MIRKTFALVLGSGDTITLKALQEWMEYYRVVFDVVNKGSLDFVLKHVAVDIKYGSPAILVSLNGARGADIGWAAEWPGIYAAINAWAAVRPPLTADGLIDFTQRLTPEMDMRWVELRHEIEEFAAMAEGGAAGLYRVASPLPLP